MEAHPARPLPALGRLFPDLYYGWFVVAGTFGLSIACVGIGFYVQQVLVGALTELRGFDRVTVSGLSSVFFMSGGLVGFLIGPWVDRRGARTSIFAGSLVLAAAIAAIGAERDVRWLWLWYPLMSIGFGLCTAVPTNAILTRWFVRRRSLATMLSQTGVSLGGAVMLPVAAWLLDSGGFEYATRWLAGAIVVIALPIVVFVLRFDPADHGLAPDGDGPARAARRAPVGVAAGAQQRVWRRRDAVRTRTFWLLAAAFGMVLASQVGMIAHQLAALAEQVSVRSASFGASLIPIGSILGRFVFGSIADRVEKRLLAIALCTVQGLAILAFSLSEGVAALYASSFVFGTTIGSIFMMQSLITADLFGIPSFGRVYGTLQLCSQLASGTGPLLVGGLYAAYGGYPLALRSIVILSLLGALALVFVRAPIPPDDAATV